MNILLWALQIVLAWLSIAGGYFQMFKIEELRKNVASMRALPQGLWFFFGATSCLAGVGLIAPGAVNWLPELTPYAAAIVATESLLISGLYVRYRDFSPLIFSTAMALIAVFICYGRFVLAPF